jgi:ATP-dependent DNA helicase RecG
VDGSAKWIRLVQVMSTTPAEIDRWIAVPREHERLEFKEAKTQYDQAKLQRYCVAIANEGGGKLLFGVTDKPPRKVVGSAAARDPAGMATKLLVALKFRVDVEAVTHPNGRVVVFHVPARPRGTAYSVDGAYWMRSGESLVPMSESKLRQIFQEGQADWLEEVSKSGLSPQEVVGLLDTQRFFELLNAPYPTAQDGVIERLRTERLIDLESETGTFAIRRIGGLMLAKRLGDFEDLQFKAPRLVVYIGKSKLDTRLDQTWDKGYASSFAELVSFVSSQLPQNEALNKTLRTEQKLVPDVVVRELVANALIHQEFRVGGVRVMIEVYADRLEISNPGTPVVPVERFIDGYQSRNERLADLMRRMGICEEKSSGIDRVVSAAEAYQLPAPVFESAHERTAVVIFRAKQFVNMSGDERIRACYQHCALKHVMREPMTNKSLRGRFGLGGKSVPASQVISATVEAGLITLDPKVGKSKRLARYLPFWA